MEFMPRQMQSFGTSLAPEVIAECTLQKTIAHYLTHYWLLTIIIFCLSHYYTTQ